jgi:aspartate aminotransferase-like enzyme
MKLFTPGPIAMDDETIAIGGTQAQYFRTPAFSSMMLECEAMLRETLEAPDDTRMIFLTASGTAAMEASVMNLFTPNDKVLIINGGTFGKRFKQICAIHRIPFEAIDLEWNEAFKPEMLNQYENSGLTGMLVNVCETSTGQLYPMDVISSFCKRNCVCLVLDTISAFLCDPFSMKETGADAVIISSQKGLALHPGMSFVAVSKKAFDERCLKNDVKSMYFNFKDYAEDMVRGQTPFTPAVAIINQLHEKLKRLLIKGVPASIVHISKLAAHFRQSFSKQKHFNIPDYYPLSNSLTPVYCANQNAKKVFDFLKDNYEIYVTPCAGDIAPFLFRVAHMSPMLNIGDIDELIKHLRIFEEKEHDCR